MSASVPHRLSTLNAPDSSIVPFYPSAPARASSTKQRSTFFKSKWFIALLVLLAVLIVGISVGAFWSSFQPQSAKVVGQLHFSSSGSSSKSYDTLQIDVQSIPPPPAGKIYVAWIDQVANESDHPHWQLQLNHDNSIHMAHLTYPNFNNLLMPSSLFIITQQDDGSSLIVPSASPTDRLYYARISTQPSSAVNLYQCPADPNAVTCF
jgi:hypothetical protein